MSRRPAALIVVLPVVGACVPFAGGPTTFEDRQPCPGLSLTLPPSDPALGGHDAGPGPIIGGAKAIQKNKIANRMGLPKA